MSSKDPQASESSGQSTKTPQSKKALATFLAIATLGLLLAFAVLMYLGDKQKKQDAKSTQTQILTWLEQQKPRLIQMPLTQGSVLQLDTSKGQAYCPKYVQQNAALNQPRPEHLSDLTITDGKTVVLVDGRNLITKALPDLERDLQISPDTAQTVKRLMDLHCAAPIRVTNAPLHPLWGK